MEAIGPVTTTLSEGHSTRFPRHTGNFITVSLCDLRDARPTGVRRLPDFKKE